MDLIGVVEVPVARLLFVEGCGERLYSESHQKHLIDLFRDTETDYTNARHLIDGYIDSSEVASILGEAGLNSLQIKQQNSEGKIPCIDNVIVRYTHGQHRIAAAKSIDPSARWAIRLHHTNICGFASQLAVRRRTEQYQHEKPYSDGQIYTKLRMYMDEPFDYNEWYHRLTRPKKTAMLAIDQRINISLALNKLIDIPAVFDELLLTSIHKSLILRLDEELLVGIDSLYSVWFRLAGGNTNTLKQMDKKTVAALAGRAPGASHSDLWSIRTMFQSGQAFPRVNSSQERDALELHVEQTTGLIPSLQSLQSNLKFLGIAAQIIWAFILPKSLRRKAKLEKRSLKSTLRDCWKATGSYIEIREGEFASAFGPPNFDLVYVQIFLAAIRQFPYLSDAEPRVEKGEKLHFPFDQQCVALFCQRAKFLGIQTSTIDEHIENSIHDLSHNQAVPFRNLLGESEVLARVESRWGRPTTTMYRIFQLQGFLPTLMHSVAASELSSLFVLRSTLLSFFNLPFFSIDSTQASYSINLEPRKYRYHELDTIAEESEVNSEVDHQLGMGSDSDVSMPDFDCRLVDGSGPDASMRDARPLLDGRSTSDVSMSNTAPIEDAVNMVGRATVVNSVENQVQAARFDTTYFQSNRCDMYDDTTDQLHERNGAVLNQNDENLQNNYFIDASQTQKPSRPRYGGANQLSLVPQHSHIVLPSESRRYTTRLEDDQRVSSCIQMGESAMTPPGSSCQAGNIHARPPFIPASPSQRSSMVTTPQPNVGLDTLSEQSNWHRGSSFRSSNGYLPLAAMLEPSISPSPRVPHRLSEVPTAIIPSSMSISDLQSTSSQPQFSYIHSNSPSHIMSPPSLQSDTVTRSSYTMPYSLYHGHGDATSAQKKRHYPANWQGFNDSDDEYESIDID